MQHMHCNHQALAFWVCSLTTYPAEPDMLPQQGSDFTKEKGFHWKGNRIRGYLPQTNTNIATNSVSLKQV